MLHNYVHAGKFLSSKIHAAPTTLPAISPCQPPCQPQDHASHLTLPLTHPCKPSHLAQPAYSPCLPSLPAFLPVLLMHNCVAKLQGTSAVLVSLHCKHCMCGC